MRLLRIITCLIISAFMISLIGCGGGGNGSGTKTPPEKKVDPKGSETNPIIMGFNPAESSEKLELNADALSKVIEEKTGLKIKTYVAQSYPALVTALQNEHVDFAWLPVFAFVKAEEVAGAEVLLKAVRNGDPYYYGAIVVRSDSPYKTIQDLKGKTIAWASETSASGRIFPAAAMMKLGLDPETFFSKSIIAGGHDTALLALYNGKVDAAATFASDNRGEKGSWTQLLDKDKAGQIRPILFTDPIPADTMSTSKKFREANPEIVAKITEVVKGLSETEEGRKALKDLYNIDGMIDATSADYEPVREAARMLGIDVEGKSSVINKEKTEEPKEGDASQKSGLEEKKTGDKEENKEESKGG